jgi:hypothetical protein
VRSGELAQHTGVRITGAELLPQGVAHPLVDDEVAARTRQELEQSALVVLIRIEPELATVEPVRQDRLVELRDLERAGQILAVPRFDRSHEVSEHSVEIVHVCQPRWDA